MGSYFRDLKDAFITTFKGMSVTMQHLLSKPVTVHYPDEHLPIPDSYLGKHKLGQPECTGCTQCVKICPVECLEIDLIRHGKVLEWKSFTVNYNHCMFCGLCVEKCPQSTLHMTKEYNLCEVDRNNCILDLLSYRGLRPEDIEAIEKAKKAKEEKEKKKAEEEAKKTDGDKPDEDKKDSKKKPPADKKKE